MKSKTVVRDGAIGAVSGLTAAFAMNQFQSAWSALQKRLAPESGQQRGGDEPSTVKAANRASEAVAGESVPEPKRKTAGQAVHYGFGALLGRLYGGSAGAFPKLTTGFGAPFGAATWAIADEAAVPAAGLSKSPGETPLPTHGYALASLLLFGAVLEGSRRALQDGLAALSGKSKRRKR
jgi:putative membrane protein